MTPSRPPVVTALVVALGCAGALSSPAAASPEAGAAGSSPPPLTGVTVVLDAGHQLGNRNFPGQVNRLVPAGGFRKACNTTGTTTRRGVPEATVVWRVTRVLRMRLRSLGVRVVMTRRSNRDDRWGPCVDERGRAGNRVGADLKLSLHADGATSGRGFHVIAPTDRPRWTRDIARPSRRLALAVRAGLRARRFRVADYAAGGDGLDRRGDLATLNLSDVPTVVVELGNLRDGRDARLLTSTAGRSRAAGGLALAVRRFVG